jgi:hypothetical protein
MPRRKVKEITIHLGAENIVQMRNWKEVCSKFCNINIMPKTTPIPIKISFGFFALSKSIP